jgi:hypothetical protein
MHFSFINWEYLPQPTIQIAAAIEGTTRESFSNAKLLRNLSEDIA